MTLIAAACASDGGTPTSAELPGEETEETDTTESTGSADGDGDESADAVSTGDDADSVSGSASTDQPGADQPSDVYSFANGCFALVDAASGEAVGQDDGDWMVGSGYGPDPSAPFTMQATALGRYLFYGPGGEMIAAGADGSINVTTEPGPVADWTLALDDEGALTVTNLETGAGLGVGDDGRLVQDDAPGDGQWSLTQTTGCEPFPDISPGATGEPFVGDSPDAPVRGFVDAHAHLGSFRFLGGSFHCGRPWSPYGVTVALVDCPHHFEQIGQDADSIFSAGAPGETHNTDGWPTFEGWPKHNNLTHEGTYWRWVERTWRAGLRLMVNDLVDNRALCQSYPFNDGTSCNDMDNVREQAAEMVALQDYIDAQFGGPGKGFFRLADSATEARAIINDGKLAVVLGVEVSEVLDCGIVDGTPSCDEAQIDAGLDELHDLGVRSVFPVHKFDNALGGTKYDGGLAGIIVNFGNYDLTGRWWNPETCAEGAIADNTAVSPQGAYPLVAEVVSPVFGDTGSDLVDAELPLYGPEPHCNPNGLSELGEYTIRGLMARNMIVETDHLSALARSEALDILEAADYSGVVTSHSWGDSESQIRLADIGGFVSPYNSNASGFASRWLEAKLTAPADYLFGLGFGSDMNGLGGQPGPRGGTDGGPLTYPFTTFDGGTVIDQQVSGDRTYDLNADGVAHYGLYADWFADIAVVGGDDMVNDMAQAAEAYLQMWERTEAHG